MTRPTVFAAAFVVGLVPAVPVGLVVVVTLCAAAVCIAANLFLGGSIAHHRIRVRANLCLSCVSGFSCSVFRAKQRARHYWLPSWAWRCLLLRVFHWLVRGRSSHVSASPGPTSCWRVRDFRVFRAPFTYLLWRPIRPQPLEHLLHRCAPEVRGVHVPATVSLPEDRSGGVQLVLCTHEARRDPTCRRICNRCRGCWCDRVI